MAKEEDIILPVLAGLGILLLFSGPDGGPAPYHPPPGIPVKPTDFIRKYWDEALRSQQATTIPALFTITQAGLESGWGRSAPRFNFFGIKDSPSWKGATQVLDTTEYVDGKLVHIKAVFRAYPDARASFVDHGIFFIVNPRYRSALQFTNDNIRFARAISAAGYATDPNYADKLIDAMKIVVQVLQRYKMI